MLVDSHCHLDFNDFEEDFEDVLARARENGVTAMLNAGNNIDELDKQLEISEKYPFIYTAVGVHPHNAAEYPDIRAEDFIAKAAHKKVVAIGECGLDYYYDYSPKDVQVKVFVEQIKAARETGLPLIIHPRDADDDTIAILDEEYKKGASAAKFTAFRLQKNWPILPCPSDFTFQHRESLLSTNPANCAIFLPKCRLTDCWWKPTRRFLRRCRCAADATNLLL